MIETVEVIDRYYYDDNCEEDAIWDLEVGERLYFMGLQVCTVTKDLVMMERWY